ncbi:MAG: class I SAM-dependent methyltransferase [Vulcanimicrobiaceae bacterium]
MDAQSRQQEAVLERFTRQAEHWGHLPVTDDLLSILDRIDVGKNDRVLDVAAGSGLLSRALAPRAREVVAVDITPAMLENARQAASREGITNVRFVEGEAESLPFQDGEFDLAVTRFSLHHIADPQRAVLEMTRVVRKGGRIAIIDLLAPEDAQLASRANVLERRRDPSHATTLSWSQLQAIVAQNRIATVDAYTQDRIRDLEDWLDLAGAAHRDELRAVFEREIEGGEATGLQPFRDGTAIRFHHPLGVIVARK